MLGWKTLCLHSTTGAEKGQFSGMVQMKVIFEFLQKPVCGLTTIWSGLMLASLGNSRLTLGNSLYFQVRSWKFLISFWNRRVASLVLFLFSVVAAYFGFLIIIKQISGDLILRGIKQKNIRCILKFGKQCCCISSFIKFNLQNLYQEMVSQIILYAIIGIFIGISQSAGVGGGPVLNICLMVGANYSAKESMSITYIFLMGGSIASIIKNYGKVQPQTRSLLVDYNLIMITLPMVATGSIFGTLSNHLLSEIIITGLFVIVLTYICINTYNKIKTFSSIESDKKTPLMGDTQLHQIHKAQQCSPELEKMINEDLNPLPCQKIKIIVLVFAYTLALLLVKGGDNYDSIVGLNSCGWVGNLLVIAHFGISLYSSKAIAQRTIEKDNAKVMLGYIFHNESDKMTQKKARNCIISGFCAGLMGGALGLGGAIILVPVWLNSGINQLKVVSSSPPLIFFSALISFSICLLCGRYRNVMELCFYFGLAYVGSAVVKRVAQYIAEKLQLKTIILIMLLITMASSLVTLVPFQFYKFIKDPESFVQFGRFC